MMSLSFIDSIDFPFLARACSLFSAFSCLVRLKNDSRFTQLSLLFISCDKSTSTAEQGEEKEKSFRRPGALGVLARPAHCRRREKSALASEFSVIKALKNV
jgi:hypothetical protein